MTEQVEELVDQSYFTDTEETEVEAEQVQDEPAETETDEELELVIDGEAVSPAAQEEDDVALPDDAADWAKSLRQKYKEQARELAALKKAQQAAPVQHTEPEPELVLGDEPTLESCDFDEDKLKQSLKDYYKRESEIASKKAAKEAEAEAFNKEAQEKLTAYQKRREVIAKRESDYQQAEELVQSKLSVPTQNVILMLSEQPEALVLALGRKPELLSELAKLQHDPLKLAVKIGELNAKTKFAPKVKQSFGTEPKTKAAPTKPLSGEDAKFKAQFPNGKFL